MLRYPLLHPPLLASLAATGHGSRILIADANYAHATNVAPTAEVIYLNLRPGLVGIDDILSTLLTAVPLEAVHTMRPDDGTTPEFWQDYERLLGPDLPLEPLERLEFYRTCREPDLALCIASGDTRHYANLLLTVGFLPPG
ncbi:RbsD/FucU family protein [Actinophytocola sp.]|uniref:RbsD/FucU family protein n=1 Tax=Actinophytocola sp. TaxID=1872138 RepID=UPI002ED31A81